MAVSVF